LLVASRLLPVCTGERKLLWFVHNNNLSLLARSLDYLE
jgi:hypothetical protein